MGHDILLHTLTEASMLILTLDLETESRLKAAASRHQVSEEQYAAQLIQESLSCAPAAPGGSEALSKWEAVNETDDPSEIARRQLEFEEFKEAMNRNRLETEGTNARIIFP